MRFLNTLYNYYFFVTTSYFYNFITNIIVILKSSILQNYKSRAKHLVTKNVKEALLDKLFKQF
jgi:hypothetical protein